MELIFTFRKNGFPMVATRTVCLVKLDSVSMLALIQGVQAVQQLGEYSMIV